MPTGSADIPSAVTQLAADQKAVDADVARLVADEVVPAPPPPPPANPLPDMIVTAMGPIGSPAAGAPVTFTVTVKNQGTASPPAAIFTGIGFYLDGVDITYAGVTQAIAPGQTIGPLSALAPWKATPGAHTLVAWVNDVARYPEVLTTNNKMTVTFTVAGPPAPAKPVNLTPPVITNPNPSQPGQVTAGDTVVCDPGTWGVAVNHDLTDADGCTRCGVAWTGLTPADRIMLTTRGKCLGRIDRWHKCAHSGSWCRGGLGHSACVELTSSAVQGASLLTAVDA